MRAIANIFWNPTQKRIRAGWRILVHFFLFFTVLLSRDIFTSIFQSAPPAVITINLLFLVCGLGLAWFMARFIDRRPFADFGFHLDSKWWLDSAFGLLLGAFLMTGVFLSMRALGWVKIVGTATTNFDLPFHEAFLLRVLFFAVAAVNEELTFRGYQLKNLSEGFAGSRFGPRAAIVLAFLCSSSFFGFLHLTSENSTVFSALLVSLAGLVVALPYLLTGELGLSIGLHFGWNFFEATVFGFAVSGNLQNTRFLSIQQVGPDLWTGGSFGPEAGLLGFIWAFFGCGLTILWVKWLRKRVELYTPLTIYTPRQRKFEHAVEEVRGHNELYR
jgi:uncharacterized protein